MSGWRSLRLRRSGGGQRRLRCSRTMGGHWCSGTRCAGGCMHCVCFGVVGVTVLVGQRLVSRAWRGQANRQAPLAPIAAGSQEERQRQRRHCGRGGGGRGAGAAAGGGQEGLHPQRLLSLPAARVAQEWWVLGAGRRLPVVGCWWCWWCRALGLCSAAHASFPCICQAPLNQLHGMAPPASPLPACRPAGPAAALRAGQEAHCRAAGVKEMEALLKQGATSSPGNAFVTTGMPCRLCESRQAVLCEAPSL